MSSSAQTKAECERMKRALSRVLDAWSQLGPEACDDCDDDDVRKAAPDEAAVRDALKAIAAQLRDALQRRGAQ